MCPNQRFNSEYSYDRTVCLCQPEDLEILACKTMVFDVKEWIQMRLGNVRKKKRILHPEEEAAQPNDVMLGKHHILLFCFFFPVPFSLFEMRNFWKK